MSEDIRWKQRFSNYTKALKKLTEAIDYIKKDLANKEINLEYEEAKEVLDEIIKEGLIQRFEYTHELAWNVMKDFLAEVGNLTMYGSKDATRQAIKSELVIEGDTWMEMIQSRNKTSHTYNEEIANEIYTKIIDEYHSAFQKFQFTMEEKRTGSQQTFLDKE